MKLIWILILIIIILAVVIWILRKNSRKPVILDVNYIFIKNKCKRKKEEFEQPARNVNAAILYAVYKADPNDYAFVEEWSKDIPFYIVNNGDPTEHAEKMKALPNVRFMVRENKGYDTNAWKAGMDTWNDELSTYDVVAFVNNSCVYGVDVKKILTNAMDYDAYGLTSFNLFPVIKIVLQTPFVVYNKRLYNSEFFKNHWNNVGVNSYLDACLKHEYCFSVKLRRAGYKLGAYDIVNGNTVYGTNKKDSIYKREFIKKKPRTFTKKRRNAPEAILNEYIMENAHNGYEYHLPLPEEQ